MAIYRGPGGPGDATADAASTAQLALTYANNAAASAAAAQLAETNAETAETNAELAEVNAGAAQIAAETAETNAATSATNAANSASAATTSATNASNSASSASTSATNASNSASAASTSATNASNSASAAATSATNASNSASAASTSATNAASSATSAANSYDAFDDRYLGSKSSAPTLDNDGNALLTGALYFDTVTNSMKVYNGSSWLDAYANTANFLLSANNLSDLTNTTTARTNLGLGTIATQAANNVAITGGSITGITDLAVADGGTGASSLSGVVIGNGTSAFTTKTNPSGDFVGTTDTQTLTNKTLTDPTIIGTVLEDVFTITDGAAFEVDPGNGSIQLITLGASRTPKATNFAAGESVTLMVDDGTARTLTWTDATWGGSGVIWETNGGVAPTLATSGYTTIVLWKVGTQVYGARVGDA